MPSRFMTAASPRMRSSAMLADGWGALRSPNASVAKATGHPAFKADVAHRDAGYFTEPGRWSKGGGLPRRPKTAGLQPNSFRIASFETGEARPDPPLRGSQAADLRSARRC